MRSHKCVAQGSLFKPCGSSRSFQMNKEIEKPQGRERALRYGLEIDPAERDPHLREEA